MEQTRDDSVGTKPLRFTALIQRCFSTGSAGNRCNRYMLQPQSSCRTLCVLHCTFLAALRFFWLFEQPYTAQCCPDVRIASADELKITKTSCSQCGNCACDSPAREGNHDTLATLATGSLISVSDALVRGFRCKGL